MRATGSPRCASASARRSRESSSGCNRPASGATVLAGRSRWLLVRGRGDRPLDRHVDPAAIRAHSSSKRPSVQRGDFAILYAAVWQALYGVVEVVSDPAHDPTRDRWSWRFEIRPLTVVGDLHEAPPVEAAGVFPQSLWRHSHIRLTPEQFEAARELIETAVQRVSGASSSSHVVRGS